MAIGPLLPWLNYPGVEVSDRVETFIKHFDDPVAAMWGMYVSGLAALALLVGSVLIQGASDDALPPPD